jgi:hypothetical protein
MGQKEKGEFFDHSLNQTYLVLYSVKAGCAPFQAFTAQAKMKPEEHNASLEPKCTQLRLLKQELTALRQQRELAESIKESNLRAAETLNLDEEAQHIKNRYLKDLSKIEKAIRRTEMRIHALQGENPCRLPEGRNP